VLTANVNSKPSLLVAEVSLYLPLIKISLPGYNLCFFSKKTSYLRWLALNYIPWHYKKPQKHIPSRNQLRNEFIPHRREVPLLLCWYFYLLKHGAVCVFGCIVGVLWNSGLTAIHYQPSTTKYRRYQRLMWGTKSNINCLL